MVHHHHTTQHRYVFGLLNCRLELIPPCNHRRIYHIYEEDRHWSPKSGRGTFLYRISTANYRYTVPIHLTLGHTEATPYSLVPGHSPGGRQKRPSREVGGTVPHPPPPIPPEVGRADPPGVGKADPLPEVSGRESGHKITPHIQITHTHNTRQLTNSRDERWIESIFGESNKNAGLPHSTVPNQQ